MIITTAPPKNEIETAPARRRRRTQAHSENVHVLGKPRAHSALRGTSVEMIGVPTGYLHQTE